MLINFPVCYGKPLIVLTAKTADIIQIITQFFIVQFIDYSVVLKIQLTTSTITNHAEIRVKPE